MARLTKAQQKALADAEAKAQEEYADIVDAASLEPALQALRSKFNLGDGELDDVSVYVYLCNADESGNDFRVWESDDPDAYNLKSIARKFGSGRYRLRVYAGNGQGSKPCIINRVQGILLSPDEDAAVTAAKAVAKNPVSAPVNNGADMLGAIDRMMSGFQTALTAALARPQIDPLAQMTQLAGLLKSLQPATPANPMADLPGLLQTLKTLKDITAGDASGETSATERLMLKAADAFLPAVAQGMQKQNAPAADAPTAALPAPVEPLTEEQEAMKLMEQMKIKAFQLQLMAANKAAARGVQPAAYAETIYDAFDDADVQSLIIPDWFEQMCAAVPACAQHAEWYRQLRAALVTYAVEDDLLAQDADGNLTLPVESGTKDADDTGVQTHGVVAASTGSPAAGE